jgi:hypothetical protein
MGFLRQINPVAFADHAIEMLRTSATQTLLVRQPGRHILQLPLKSIPIHRLMRGLFTMAFGFYLG